MQAKELEAQCFNAFHRVAFGIKTQQVSRDAYADIELSGFAFSGVLNTFSTK